MGNYSTGALIISILVFLGMRRTMQQAKHGPIGPGRGQASKTNFQIEWQEGRPVGGIRISGKTPSVTYQY